MKKSFFTMMFSALAALFSTSSMACSSNSHTQPADGQPAPSDNDKKPRIQFQPFTYQLTTAVLECQVTDADNAKDVPTLTWVFQDAVTSEEVVTPLTLQPDGKYRGEAKMWGPSRCLLSVGDNDRIFFFVEPNGAHNAVFIDLKKLREKAQPKEVYGFGGSFTQVNTELLSQPNPRMLFQPMTQKAKGMQPAAYKQMLMDLYQKADAELVKSGISNETILLMEADWQQELCIYQSLQTLARLNGKRDFKEYTVPEGYYDNLLAYHIGSNVMQPYTLMNHVTLPILEQLAQENPAFQAQVDEIAGQPIQKARQALQQIANFTPLEEQQLAALKTTAAQFYPIIEQKQQELKQKQAADAQKGGFRIMSIAPELAGEEIFKSIIAPYKGKPVLVDFWATWCGPCRRAMETIKPVKEALAGKATFVYVTGPTSPEGLWKSMISDIHGDHYYVTEDQWSTLLNQFESRSIPTYVVVDKDGNVTAKHIGFPGVDVLQQELEAGM